jgi:hypothetical protein
MVNLNFDIRSKKELSNRYKLAMKVLSINDLLMATDRDQLSALCLLNLTAAFDTVDHELLLTRLENRFGLKEQPLS